MLLKYLNFPFVQYALIVGCLVALCSALLGVVLVLKRFSYMGDSLSHVSFGALSVAWVIGLLNSMLLTLPITILASIYLLVRKNKKIQGDAALAMLSTSSLAFGYFIMNQLGNSSNIASDVCTYLFGSMSILTLTSTDVWLCVIISISVIIVFITSYHKIFSITFDETFAEVTGQGLKKYNILIAILVATVIVLAMNLVGALLVTALITFPALSAMSLFKNFKAVILCASIISVAATLGGILASLIVSSPVGSTIVLVNASVFLFCKGVGKCVQR